MLTEFTRSAVALILLACSDMAAQALQLNILEHLNILGYLPALNCRPANITEK